MVPASPSRVPSRRVVAPALAASGVVLAACGPGLPAGAGAPPLPPMGPDPVGGKACKAVSNPLSPSLVAWTAGDRDELASLRAQGAVAVRYRVQGCNVELEVLSGCIGKGVTYTFTPSPSQKQDVITSESQLFAELPLGAAGLSGKLKGRRALRTDYQIVGVASLPAERTFQHADLEGPDCARATHVVQRVHLGGFAMTSGTEESLEASASFFGLGGGAEHGTSAQRMFSHGTPAACERSASEGKEVPGCQVPLRIGLLPLGAAAAPTCPDGSIWDGQRCVRHAVVTEVQCPAGTRWDGTACQATVSKACPAGLHFEEGKGCVPDVAPTSPAASAATRTQPTAAAAKPPAVSPAAGVTTRGPSMVAVPAGTFQMGSRQGDEDERPVHWVTMTAFELDRTEVTVAQYRACVDAGTCTAPGGGSHCNWGKPTREDHPANCIDWVQAGGFCAWAGKRLPSEEEWEYAARGEEGRPYPWGMGEPARQLCWKRGDQGTCRVGSFSAGASPSGALDLAGNVWEWTASSYCPYGLKDCGREARVSRGGAWVGSDERVVRATHRRKNEPGYRSAILGFRCAR